MNEYLQKLEETFVKKNIKQFCVFPDIKPFKIIKKDRSEMEEIMIKNPKKYAGRHLAAVFLYTAPHNFKRKDYIFSIGIQIFKIYEDGSINKSPYDSWSVTVKYMSDDLEKHPFKMETVEKLMNLVNKKYIKSEVFSIYYDEFERRINDLKNKVNKKSSRVKSKKTFKNTSKKISRKTSKKTSKKISKKTSKKRL